MLARMVFRSLAHSPGVTLWSLGSLAVAAALVTVFATLPLETGGKMALALRESGANATLRGASLDTDEGAAGAARFARDRGALAAALSARSTAIRGLPVAMVAADPDDLARLTPYWHVEGARPRSPGECLVGERLALRIGAAPGGRVEARFADSGEALELAVAGVAASGDEDDDRVHVAAFPEPSGKLALPPGHPDPAGPASSCGGCHTEGVPSAERRGAARVDRWLLLRVDGGDEGIARLEGDMRRAGFFVDLEPIGQVLEGEKNVLETIRLLTGMALVFVLSLAALGAGSSALARVLERRKELALLAALGATRRRVALLLVAESAATGFAASVAGFGLGALLVRVVFQIVFRAQVGVHPIAFVAALAATLAVSIGVGAAAGARSLTIDAAVALRGEG